MRLIFLLLYQSYLFIVLGFLIATFILYSFKILFPKVNVSWLIYESIKSSDIKISIVFSLFFANNHAFVFLNIDLYFLISAFIIQTFNPTAELSIPIGIPNNKAKPEIKTKTVIVETKINLY